MTGCYWCTELLAKVKGLINDIPNSVAILQINYNENKEDLKNEVGFPILYKYTGKYKVEFRKERTIKNLKKFMMCLALR